MQAQDTLDNSMFDFSIREIEGDDAYLAGPSSASMPDDIKGRLEEILLILDQDISLLVQNAEPIWSIYLMIKNQIPDNILEVLTLAALIENLQVQVIRAEKKLAGRIHHAKVIKDSKTQ